MPHDAPQPPTPDDPARRRPYRRPSVRVHGTIAMMTNAEPMYAFDEGVYMTNDMS